ncbi:MAG TPA: Calx-beta domain-containing protein [Pyrinomonadaceae bacterium]|jgi:outer membrane biosynthesis protein TonB|nr:Calx-beta domain-containing protein [Pyrinomonadaceae bacterium]
MLEAIKNKRQAVLLGCVLTCLLSGLAVAGFAGRHFVPTPERRDNSAGNEAATPDIDRRQARFSEKISLASTPAANQFEVVRNLVAGGGSNSAGGQFELNGSAGQAAAGTQMNGGQFSLTGGFWQPELTVAATPTPTPTATPTPAATPTPTVTPSPLPTATPTPNTSPTPNVSPTPNTSPTPNVSPTPSASPTPAAQNIVQFDSATYAVQEDCTTLTINVTRTGDTSNAAAVDYHTSDVTATDRKDYITALGRLQFAPGETSKSIVVLINEDSFVEGNETFNLNLSNPSGATLGVPAVAAVTIVDDSTEPVINAIDDPSDYVCQHYHDFLNRQPDASGLGFWTNEINSCGTDALCLENKRINVSAAFYVSIEFQQTGYLVERLYRTAFGSATATSSFGGPHQFSAPVVRLNEFLSDTQKIGQGVIVGQPSWEQALENNKQSFTGEFVQRSRFVNAFPASMGDAQFVDTLNANAGSPLSQAEHDQLVNDLSSNTKTRAQVLRAIAEHPNLIAGEFNRAFVLMQYFGYLRRNPNDAPDSDYSGFDFWLTKLNQFHGDYINAEMVKAFITSSEYRQRFGQ